MATQREIPMSLDKRADGWFPRAVARLRAT